MYVCMYVYKYIYICIWTVFKLYIFREGDSEERVETEHLQQELCFLMHCFGFLSQFKILSKEEERSSLKVFEEILTGAHFYS